MDCIVVLICTSDTRLVITARITYHHKSQTVSESNVADLTLRMPGGGVIVCNELVCFVRNEATSVATHARVPRVYVLIISFQQVQHTQVKRKLTLSQESQSSNTSVQTGQGTRRECAPLSSRVVACMIVGSVSPVILGSTFIHDSSLAIEDIPGKVHSLPADGARTVPPGWGMPVSWVSPMPKTSPVSSFGSSSGETMTFGMSPSTARRSVGYSM